MCEYRSPRTTFSCSYPARTESLFFSVAVPTFGQDEFYLSPTFRVFPQPFTKKSSPNIEERSRLAKSANAMMNETLSEMLLAAEVAQWLRVRPSTIYSWAATGHIPSVRLNGTVRFIRTDIQRWIDACSKDQVESHPSSTRPIVPLKPSVHLTRDDPTSRCTSNSTFRGWTIITGKLLTKLSTPDICS